MKIRIYSPDRDAEKTIWIPTGFLFSKISMYIVAKLASRQARKDYEQKLIEMSRSGWDADPDELLTSDDIQKAERLTPPINEQQVKELLAALRDSKYLLRGLPLLFIDSPDGERVRIDL
ncbi:MAG: hypothetical protein IKK57_13195 [Clostridia bacterium]|nr:hypothetical protein [Clostridia bacterium]